MLIYVHISYYGCGLFHKTKILLRYIYLKRVSLVIAVCRLLQHCYPFAIVSVLQFRPPYVYMNFVMFIIGQAAPQHNQSIGLVLGYTLFWCWMSLSCFFIGFTFKGLFNHSDYWFYLHVYVHGYLM